MDVQEQDNGVGEKEEPLNIIQKILDQRIIADGIRYDSSSVCVFNTCKMLEIRTMVTGHGRGTRTTIVNMVDIAQALARPAFYICNYFGMEMNTLSLIHHTPEEFKIVGDHSAAKLGGAIHSFVNKFVECYECGSPQTEVVIIRRTRGLHLDCGACGFKSKVDMMEPLALSIRRDHFEVYQGFRFEEPARQDFKIVDKFE